MQSLLTRFERVPGFASKRERNVWFASSVAAIALGVWFVATLLRFHGEPAHFELAPSSMIPAFWFVAALGFCLGGGVGASLGIYRLKNTTINL